MVYITGDMHGDISCFDNPKLRKLSAKDYLIVCGDFGFLWDPKSEKERKTLDSLKEKKYNICFVDGAHENFDMVNGYKLYRWKGGNVHKIADNIFHLMRGEVFTLDDRTFFTLGGGESEDIDMREEGVSWWKEELPGPDDMKNAEDNLKAFDYKVNYILTYEAPAIAKDFLRLQTNRAVRITPLNIYLQDLMKNVDYIHWYFGSLHTDMQITGTMTAVFNDIYEITK